MSDNNRHNKVKFISIQTLYTLKTNSPKGVLTSIQEEKFLAISGHEFTFDTLAGNFNTAYPYNNKEWQYSPVWFEYIIEKETGNMICELSHKMTNNRIYGWDSEGNELPDKILHKYFECKF